jgi:hypothetical protein
MFLVGPKVFSFVVKGVKVIYRVLAAILKMADISKILKMQNCSSNGELSLCQIRSPFSKWPPQYRTNSTLFDFNVLN